MPTQFPIYTTSGDWAAMLVGRYIYNPQGDWIGWVEADSQVFSVRGEYAGWLSKDFRILCHRDTTQVMPRRGPPPTQPRLEMPTTVPLPPMMSELTFDTIDLFEDAPRRLDPYDMDQVQDID
jgi:hypothetical protein